MPQISREQTPWEVLAIAELLRQNPEGEVLTYAALSEVAGGIDVQKQRPNWHRIARKIVLKEGIHYGCVPNIGLKRLTPDDALKYGESGRVCVQRSVRRTGERLININAARLSSEKNAKLSAYIAMCAALQATAALKSIKHYLETGRLPDIVPLTPAQLNGAFKPRARGNKP